MSTPQKPTVAPAYSRIPVELWETILADAELPATTLFHLALMSQSLYYASIAAYIRGVGVPKFEQGIVIHTTLSRHNHTQPRYDALTALRLPFYDPGGTKEVEYTVKGGGVGIYHDVEAIAYHLERLSKAVANLAFVESFALTFRGLNIRRPSESTGLEKLTWRIGQLLDLLLEEKRCRSIALDGLQDLGSLLYHYERIPAPKGVIPRILNIPFLKALQKPFRTPTRLNPNATQGDGWRFVQMYPTGSSEAHQPLSPTALQKNELQRISFRSHSLFSPPLLSWTYSLLQQVKIQTLELTCYRWAILSTMAFPTVQALTISHSMDASLDEFTTWIERSFLSLIHLTLPSFRRNYRHPLPHYPIFPKLTTLTLCPDWFYAWFSDEPRPSIRTHRSSPSDPDRRNSFPALQDFILLLNPETISPLSAIKSVLKRLADIRRSTGLQYVMTYKLVGPGLLFHMIECAWSQWSSLRTIDVCVKGNPWYPQPHPYKWAGPESEWAGCFTNVVLVNTARPRWNYGELDWYGPSIKYGAEWLAVFDAMESLVLEGFYSETDDMWPYQYRHLIPRTVREKLKTLRVDDMECMSDGRFLGFPRIVYGGAESDDSNSEA